MDDVATRHRRKRVYRMFVLCARQHWRCPRAFRPQDITAFFLAIHARGGQLGISITNALFSDEAHDEFIRCSTKYPNILGTDWCLAMGCRTASLRTAFGVAEGANGSVGNSTANNFAG